MNSPLKIKVSVICAPGENARTYGYYIGYSLEEVITISNNFPKHWTGLTISKEI